MRRAARGRVGLPARAQRVPACAGACLLSQALARSRVTARAGIALGNPVVNSAALYTSMLPFLLETKRISAAAAAALAPVSRRRPRQQPARSLARLARRRAGSGAAGLSLLCPGQS